MRNLSISRQIFFWFSPNNNSPLNPASFNFNLSSVEWRRPLKIFIPVNYALRKTLLKVRNQNFRGRAKIYNKAIFVKNEYTSETASSDPLAACHKLVLNTIWPNENSKMKKLNTVPKCRGNCAWSQFSWIQPPFCSYTYFDTILIFRVDSNLIDIFHRKILFLGSLIEYQILYLKSSIVGNRLFELINGL